MSEERITNYYIPASGSRLRCLETSQPEDQHEENYYIGNRENSEEDSK